MKRPDKEELLRRLHAAVTSPLTVGGLETQFNLSDMYTNFQNRQEVLAVLQDRYPHALAEMPALDAQSWFEKISSLQHHQSYVSAYAGQVGEDKAIPALEALGKEAWKFSSLTHQANDLHDSDGIEWSVKSYKPDGSGSFLSIVRHTPESQHYVVNEELYAELEHSGKIADLKLQGVEVINGHFSHLSHSDQASDVLERISAHQDVHDSIWNNVPVVACIVGIASAGVIGHRYLSGASSRHEVAMDLLGTCARFAAGTGGAASGTAVGATIGTAVLPILGTIIGGTIGGLLGSFGARELVRDAVARSKWGTALDAFSEVGARYRDGLPPTCIDAIATTVFHRPGIATFVQLEKPRIEQFERELDLSDPTPPSPAAVLWETSLTRAEAALPKIDDASNQSAETLIDLCVKEGVARFPRQRESARAAAFSLYGSFLVETPFLRNALPNGESVALQAALQELQSNPNHPYRLANAKADILAALALRMLITPESVG